MKHLLSLFLLMVFNHAFTQSPAYITTDKAIADIEQLIATFENVHYNPYFKTSKKVINTIKDEQLSSWKNDSVPMRQFIGICMKLTAMMSGGHSGMNWQHAKLIPEIKAHVYLPFTGKLVEEDGIFIVTKSGLSVIVPGMKIKSINGISVVKLFKECMAYSGGIDAYKIANVERAFPVYLFFNDSLKAPYSIAIADSDELFTTDGIRIAELAKILNSSVKQVDYSFDILDNNIGLMAYNSSNNYKKFNQFLKATFKTIQAKHIDKLIIDIRANGGGNSSLNDLLLSYITTKPYQQASGRYWKVSEESKKAYANNKVYTKLFGKDFMVKYMKTPNQTVIVDLDSTGLVQPEKPPYYFTGKTCLLIGPSTFSSANFLADAVKTYQITTLIGSPTGEYTNDFGEQISFVLKNTKSEVNISSTYDIGANGNDSIMAPVYPDIEVATDVLKYAMNWLENNAEKK
ncbi:S41 family peptidase [Putridiphycobacter roseus]|nr:S41 family peptidase [Putridiphycobacter roseus]